MRPQDVTLWTELRFIRQGHEITGTVVSVRGDQIDVTGFGDTPNFVMGRIWVQLSPWGNELELTGEWEVLSR